MASSVLGIVLHLIPGICRDLAANIHHDVKHLNPEGLIFHQQVARVLSYCRDGKYQSGCRMASAAWRPPGECPQGSHRALLGFPSFPQQSNETP